MSGREWKPGDVAKLTTQGGREHIALRVGWPADDWISATEGGIYGAQEIRPLVVIDPESNDVERLQDLYLAAEAKGLSGLSMQAALREFANPTPPKPPEPTGLGAVVEVRGCRWVYTGDSDGGGQWWYSAAEPARWSEFASVDVLCEGVTP